MYSLKNKYLFETNTLKPKLISKLYTSKQIPKKTQIFKYTNNTPEIKIPQKQIPKKLKQLPQHIPKQIPVLF